jgi:hypothetical protein
MVKGVVVPVEIAAFEERDPHQLEATRCHGAGVAIFTATIASMELAT